MFGTQFEDFLSVYATDPIILFISGLIACIYLSFWLLGMYHAAITPKAHVTQRCFWVGAILVNPLTCIWYWYVWKRWIFWLLFTPLFIGICSIPLFIRTAFSPNRTIVFFGIMLLCIFPVLFRLATLLHMGKNSELDALRRTDWAVCFAFPLFGFGVSMIYATRYMHTWALMSLAWWLAASVSTSIFISRILYIF